MIYGEENRIEITHNYLKKKPKLYILLNWRNRFRHYLILFKLDCCQVETVIHSEGSAV